MHVSRKAITLQRQDLDSFDAGAMRGAVQGGSLEHVLIAGQQFAGRIIQAETRGGRFAWGRYTRPVLAEGPMPSDMVTIGMALTGAKEAIFNCEQIAPNEIMFFGEHAELCTTLPADGMWFALQMPPEALGEVGIEGHGASFEHVRLADDLGLSLGASVRTKLATIEGLPEGAGGALAQHMADIEDTVLSACARNDASHCGVRGHRSTHRRRRDLARDVADYIRCHQDDDGLRILDISLVLGQSLRSIERAFQESYGVSPRRYLSLQRLARLRQNLLADHECRVSLTSHYLSCGLTHFGRAAAEYRSLFGELPTQTARNRGPSRMGGASY